MTMNSAARGAHSGPDLHAIALAVHLLLGDSVDDLEFGAHVDAALAAHGRA